MAQNASISLKMPQYASKCLKNASKIPHNNSKMPQNASECLKMPQNTSKYLKGVAAHQTIWIPPRTVVVSNYIQLDAIINPWLVQKRLLPCSRLPRAALEV